MSAKPQPSAEERAWRAQQDLRTLAEAEAIRSDSRRHGAAKAEAKKQVASLSRVARKK